MSFQDTMRLTSRSGLESVEYSTVASNEYQPREPEATQIVPEKQNEFRERSDEQFPPWKPILSGGGHALPLQEPRTIQRQQNYAKVCQSFIKSLFQQPLTQLCS